MSLFFTEKEKKMFSKSVTFAITGLIVLFGTMSMIQKTEPKEIKTNYFLLTQEAQKQVQCLAKNIYFEARNEPVEGQVAVAFVTLNRVNSANFPNTICDVVEQRTTRICQFSWYCESMPYYIYTNNVLTLSNNVVYNRVRDLALYVYANQETIKDPTYGSLYYHADYVNPRWNHLDKVTTIGRHIFYNERNI